MDLVSTNGVIVDTNILLDEGRSFYEKRGLTPPLDLRSLRKTLIALSGEIPHTRGRFMPSSFDPTDTDVSIFPRKEDWTWSSLGRLLRASAASSVISALPLFWQIETPLNAECRKLGAMTFFGDANNLPLLAAAVRSLNTDCICVYEKDAAAVAQYFESRGLTNDLAWIVVRDVENCTYPLERFACTDLRFHEEVHLLPGVPILATCTEGGPDRSYHLDSSYLRSTNPDGTYVTSAGDDTFPLVQLKLPFQLSSLGPCTCGAERLKIV